MKENDIAEILTSTRTIALVGASDKPDRPSYRVMKYLLDQGYHVILCHRKWPGKLTGPAGVRHAERRAGKKWTGGCLPQFRGGVGSGAGRYRCRGENPVDAVGRD